MWWQIGNSLNIPFFIIIFQALRYNLKKFAHLIWYKKYHPLFSLLIILQKYPHPSGKAVLRIFSLI